MKEPAAHAQKVSSPRELGLLKIQFGGSVRISAGVKSTKKRAQNQKFYSIFSKNRGNGRGMSPGVRILSGHPKKPLAGHTARPAFPAGGKPRFFHRLYLYFNFLFIAAFPENANPRKLWFRALARNAGHAVRPANNLWFRALARNAGHAVRPANNFLRAAKQTGVQQHPNYTSKKPVNRERNEANAQGHHLRYL